MRKFYPPLQLSVLIWLICLLLPPFNAHAAPSDGLNDDQSLSQARKILLQKGLTLYEIDQEVRRLSEKENELGRKTEDARSKIAVMQDQSALTRRHAANVIRAYYMGERQTIWTALLAAKSLSQAMTILQFVNAILQNDHLILNRYSQTKKELEQWQTAYSDQRRQLADIKTQFLKQREKLVRLQKEIDEELTKTPDSRKIAQDINALTQTWEDKGLPLFRTYFQALNEATKQLPELFSNKSNLIIDGVNYTFQVTDKEVNQFFRNQNPMLQNFSIRFLDGLVLIEGKERDTEISIKGKYVLENEQQNAIRFDIEELSYNRFILPESTKKKLLEEFDLKLYPRQIAPFFRATQVESKESRLTVRMKLDLSGAGIGR